MPYMAPYIRPLPVPAKIQRAPNHSSEEHYIYIYILCQERMCKERACPYMYAYIYIYIYMYLSSVYVYMYICMLRIR